MAKILMISSQAKGIKRLIRRQGTQEYFKEGGWTHNPHEARSFVDVIEVAQTCALYGLDDVELAIRMDLHTSDLFCTPIR